LGQFNINQLKARTAEKDEPEPEQPKTLRMYYEETLEALWLTRVLEDGDGRNYSSSITPSQMKT